MPKSEQTAELLVTSEVAQMLSVDVATVNRWARQGKVPVARKLPGDTGANLFNRSDVEALLTDQAKSAS